MNIIFAVIFILCMAGGVLFGYYKHYTWVGYTITLAISGFIGSSIIAVVFSCLYLFQKETDNPEPEESSPETDQTKGIKKIEQ